MYTILLDSDDNEIMVYVDADQIYQVMSNILINAKQAMPEGGMVSLSVKRKIMKKSNEFVLSEGQYVEIAVKDTGVGIKKEDFTNIFRPFFSTKGDGSGIGLTLARLIINQHHGIITVDSAINQGTVFTIYLPLSGQKFSDTSE